MSKKIIISILMIFVLLIGGCSSDDTATTENSNLNFVEMPQSLTEEDNQLASLFFQKALAAVTNEEVIDHSGLALYSKAVEGIENYGDPKSEDIINLEVNTFDKSLSILSINREGNLNQSEKNFDINISSSLEIPYNQIYDYKYTITPTNSEKIKTVLYKNAEDTRINMIERFENGYGNNNFYQIIHNENQMVTRILIYEEVKENKYPYVTLIKIDETEDTKKFEYLRESNEEGLIAASFAGIENLDYNNMIGALFLNTDSDNYSSSEFFINTIDLENLINSKTNGTPQIMSQFNGVDENYKLNTSNASDKNNFTSEPNYPDKQEALDIHENMINFNTISYEPNFDIENLKYTGKTLIERLGIVGSSN